MQAMVLTIEDLRRQSRRRLPRAVFDFIDGAAEDELTLRRNREAFERAALVPRVLVDVHEVDLATTVLGQRLAAPLLLAPTGLCGMATSCGEIPAARAAVAAGVAFTASCMSSVTLEEIAGRVPGEHWFQLYVWRDLDWLRGLWRGPLVVKGVLSAEDARLAADHGADAIVVSNHGGRQLDGAPATLDALPAIADRVGGRLEILLDGGVRRGADVARALALGARACMIGRPYLYRLAAGGQAGVARVIEILTAELRRVLALLGCTRVEDVGPACVRLDRR